MFDKIRKIAMIAVTTCLLMITVGLLNQRRVSAQTCSPAPVDLASWWSGDGNALDSRSRSNGTLVGDTNFVPGQVGQAFNFDGADDSVQIPHNPNQNIQGSFTAEAWVFPRSSPNISPRIFDKSNGGGFWIMATGNGVTSNTLHVNINNAILLTAGSVPLNQWTHVAFTYDVAGPTGGLNLYVNGVLLTSQTASVQTTNDTGPLRIGNEATNVRDFDGLIDEAQIYNRALSDSEILATVNAGTAGHCKPTATVAPSGLAAWWAGDGNTNDISGNGNNGTLQGGAGFSVGKVGQSFSLNANTDSGISVPNSPSLNPT